MQVNEIFCIGSNKFGQSGAGKKHHNQNFTNFTSIIFPVFIKQVVCGSHHSGLLTLEGNVYMMGSNINGALGCPTSTVNYSYSPILVENLNDVSKICSGHYHMCVISEEKLFSWGKGVDGQLGIDKQNNCCIPTYVQSFGANVEDVSCGLNHTLVKTTNQKCYAFGNGVYGQLGVGNNKNSLLPVLVKIDSVTDIAAGQNFSLFLKDGIVYGTGDNSTGQISIQKRKYFLQPTQIPIANVTTIRACRFSVAVIEDKKLCIWGLKGKTEPINLQEIQDFIMDVQVGGNLIYCLASQGELYQWTSESHGNKDQEKMIKLELGDKNVFGFSVGEAHSLVIGDIVDQISSSDKVFKILDNLQESQKGMSRKQSTLKISEQNHQNSVISEEGPPISSEHYSRTPSSILRQNNNFVKAERKGDISPAQCQKQVTVFPTISTVENVHNIQPLQNIPALTSLQIINTKNYNNIDMSELERKIDEIMTMLTKNSKIDDAQTKEEMSRKMTKSKLSRTMSRDGKENKEGCEKSELKQLKEDRQFKEEKQNRKSNRNQKNNRQLIMELRQKQLRISELQESLSRKQMEVESQRQVINLLRYINPQNN